MTDEPVTAVSNSDEKVEIYLTEASRNGESDLPSIEAELPDNVMILEAGEVVGTDGEVIGYLKQEELTVEEAHERLQGDD